MEPLESVFERIVDNGLGRSDYDSLDLETWRGLVGGANQGLLDLLVRSLDQGGFKVKLNTHEATVFSCRSPETSFYIRVLKSRPEMRFHLSPRDPRLASISQHYSPFKIDRGYSCFAVEGGEGVRDFIQRMHAAEGGATQRFSG